MKKKLLCTAMAMLFSTSALAATQQPATKYPVIFAHGMAGYDSLLGMSYFGNDYGTFVGKPCASGGSCNMNISNDQKAAAFKVSFMNNSEVRGKQLHDYVVSYCASTTNPATGKSVCDVNGVKKVNFVGHSQGGLDIRKAAKLLKVDGIGTGSLISVSSPHRGAPMASAILKNLGSLAPSAASIANVLGGSSLISGSNNLPQDTISGAKQLVDIDYDPLDGITTGTIQFNKNYPGTGDSDYLGSFITSQSDFYKQPSLLVMAMVSGFSSDDGLVDTNSQQMGMRLSYKPSYMSCSWFACVSNPASASEVTTLGSVTDINKPTFDQKNSTAGVLYADHFDVMSFGPDFFDEHEFYASIMGFISKKGT